MANEMNADKNNTVTSPCGHVEKLANMGFVMYNLFGHGDADGPEHHTFVPVLMKYGATSDDGPDSTKVINYCPECGSKLVRPDAP